RGDQRTDLAGDRSVDGFGGKVEIEIDGIVFDVEVGLVAVKTQTSLVLSDRFAAPAGMLGEELQALSLDFLDLFFAEVVPVVGPNCNRECAGESDEEKQYESICLHDRSGVSQVRRQD